MEKRRCREVTISTILEMVRDDHFIVTSRIHLNVVVPQALR